MANCRVHACSQNLKGGGGGGGGHVDMGGGCGRGGRAEAQRVYQFSKT